MINFFKKNKLKSILFIFLMAILLVYIIINLLDKEIEKKAILTIKDKGYELTLQKKYKQHPNDLSDLLSNNSIEKETIIIKRPKGIFDVNDVEFKSGNYAYKIFGKIKVYENYVEVKFYVNNYDDKKISPSFWNGIYKLNR